MADYQKYGFSGVIAKPYKINELSHVLHEVIAVEQVGELDPPELPEPRPGMQQP